MCVWGWVGGYILSVVFVCVWVCDGCGEGGGTVVAEARLCSRHVSSLRERTKTVMRKREEGMKPGWEEHLLDGLQQMARSKAWKQS